MKLTKLLSNVIQESLKKQLSDFDYIDFAESELFLELANPDMAFPYDEEEPDVWTFYDLYKNKLGVLVSDRKFVKSFFIIKDKKGKEQRIFDIETNFNALDPDDFTLGEDERRSDTIAKIIIDEIVPRHLAEKPSMLQFQMLNKYRYRIYEKIADLIPDTDKELKVKKNPDKNFISIINK